VLARDARRAYGTTQEFVINHQAVYALGEELRGLARMRSGVDLPVDTATIPAGAPQPRHGPGLMLVKGLDEGTLFPLESPPYERREWIIGRRRGVHVALDFDPFVSAENARVVWEDGRHFVVDLPESANGTSVNFAPLPRGEPRVLRHGDVIGVGRSLLLYWE
jgi:FHA domain